MYGMRGAVSQGVVYAAGFVKSTIDSDILVEPEEDEFSLTGPFSVSDPSGSNAVSKTFNLQSYSASSGAVENAGGSFGQYDVGVAKIDAITGAPIDFFVWHGTGLDETSGIAASTDGNSISISGHFTGNLTVPLADGTSQTIWNSNVGEGGIPDDADQFHPNSKSGHADTGVDDGFVIKANSNTGIADWVAHYPKSNRDSQMVSVDFDESTNVFGGGYSCSKDEGAEWKICDGVVALFSSIDGSILWEKTFSDLGAIFDIKYDREDGGLYITGTTTYGGSTSGHQKDHLLCDHDNCSVVMRLSSVDGEMQWARAVKGSPRWGVFDQGGGVAIGKEDLDGPYIYVALDDTGDGPIEDATLNAGTPYGGCLSSDGVLTPEYHIFLKKVVDQSDCDFFDESGNSTYVSRNAAEAMPASSVVNDVSCGKTAGTDACLMKFHKHTGLPMWAIDVPPIAGLVPSSDGLSVHVAGWYYPGRAAAFFDSIELPGYLREGGLGSQTSGVYNAKINSETGAGEYVIHSGGGSKDRLYDVVGDLEGNIYNIGYSMNLVMQWGNNLKTTMTEDDVDPANASSEAVETHLYVSKMKTGASEETIPSCLTTCAINTDHAIIDEDSCFIDGKCYSAGDNGDAFGKSCFVCDPTINQREWTEGPTLGLTQCFLDNRCYDAGDFLFYQRRTWSAKIPSLCQTCDPKQSPMDWSVITGYTVVDGGIPPNDCIDIVPTLIPTSSLTSSPTSSPTPSPTSLPTPSPTPSPTSPPTPSPTKKPTVPLTTSIEPTETTLSITNDSNAINNESKGLNGGAVAGIVIACLAAVVVVLFLCKTKKEKNPESNFSANDMT